MVSGNDLLRFLRSCGFEELQEAECEQIIRYFDNMGNGVLCFEDFLQIMLPCDAPPVRQIAIQKKDLRSRLPWIDPAVEMELA